LGGEQRRSLFGFDAAEGIEGAASLVAIGIGGGEALAEIVIGMGGDESLAVGMDFFLADEAIGKVIGVFDVKFPGGALFEDEVVVGVVGFEEAFSQRIDFVGDVSVGIVFPATAIGELAVGIEVLLLEEMPFGRIGAALATERVSLAGGEMEIAFFHKKGKAHGGFVSGDDGGVTAFGHAGKVVPLGGLSIVDDFLDEGIVVIVAVEFTKADLSVIEGVLGGQAVGAWKIGGEEGFAVAVGFAKLEVEAVTGIGVGFLFGLVAVLGGVLRGAEGERSRVSGEVTAKTAG